MKIVLWLGIVAQFSMTLFATNLTLLEQKATKGDALSAYRLAEYYEAHSDKENAFIWYKKASSLALKKESTLLEQSFLQNTLEKIERTQEVYGHVLSAYKDDPQTLNSVGQMMTKIFDIAPYKTNYLLPFTYNDTSFGDDRKHLETKFQLSFQKSVAENLLGLNETLLLGYTQTSWWQTAADSAPFRETNYQPEIFMIVPHFDKESLLRAYQFGLLHESNGQDSPKSRSWNRLYAKAYLQLGGLIVSPRVWYRLKEDESKDDNTAILDYLGYGDLELVYPYKAHTFRLLARHSMRFDEKNHGAIGLDWTFPLWEDGLFGYIQLFSGYGESLMDYDKRSDRIGVGFALSR